MAEDVNSDKGSTANISKVQNQQDHAQTSIEQLISGDTAHTNTHDLHAAVGYENFDGLVTVDSHTAQINPVFMQPNTEGKFELLKKEFIHEVVIDKIDENQIAVDEFNHDLEIKQDSSEFAKINFAQNLKNLAGSDLAFDKVYFDPTKEFGSEATKVAEVKVFNQGPVEIGIVAGLGAGGSGERVAATGQTQVEEISVPEEPTTNNPVFTPPTTEPAGPKVIGPTIEIVNRQPTVIASPPPVINISTPKPTIIINPPQENPPTDTPVIIDKGPPVAQSLAYTIPENGSMTITTAELLARIASEEGSTINIQNLVLSGDNGSLINNGDGTWTYSAKEGFTGSIRLHANISDGDHSISQPISISVVNVPPTVSSMLYRINEGQSVLIREIDLLARDSVLPGNTLNITDLNVPAEQGTLLNNHDGTWTFTPKDGFVGTLNLQASVSDGEVAVIQPVVVEVINLPPVVSSVSYVMNENETITINIQDLLANINVVEGDGVEILSLSAPVNQGTLIDNGNGTWSFTPNEHFVGDLSLQAIVSDGESSISQPINIKVLDIVPDTEAVHYNMSQNSSIIISDADLLARAHISAGDMFVSNLEIPADQGSLVNNDDGTWTFTPKIGFVGSIDLQATISDGNSFVPQDININVVNIPPIINNINYLINQNETLLIKASDLLAVNNTVEGNNLNIVSLSVSENQGSLVNNGDGTWSFTPNPGFVGHLNLQAAVSDGYVTVPQDVYVGVENIPPTVVSLNYSINENSSLIIRATDLLSVDFTEAGETLNVVGLSLLDNNSGAIVDNGDGTWTFTPNTAFIGSVNLQAIVTDGHDTVPQPINVSVINVPPLTTSVNYSMNEGNSFIISASDLLSKDSVIAGNDITITDLTIPASQGTLVDNHDGTWTYTPNNGFLGVVNLTATVSDGVAQVDQEVTITVKDLAPEVDPVNYSLNEDGSITINAAQLLTDSGATDFQALSVTALGASGNIHGSLVDNHNGTWTYTPAANYNGTAQLSFTVSDGILSTTSNINLTINPVNDAPTANNVDYSLNEDGSIIIRASDLLRDSGATDIDSSNLVISAISANGNIHGALTNNGDGTWTYRPDADFNGSAQLNFNISDGTETITKNINLTVNPVNDAPIAHDVFYTLNENGSLVIRADQLLANSEANDIDSSNLTVTAVSANGNIHGALVNNGDGTWTYRPDADFNGSAQLSFTVSDGQLTTTNNINLNISSINHAPTSHDVSYNLNEDGSIIIRASDLLRDGGAADIDSSNLVISAVAANGDIHGSLVDNGDGTWTYRPDADFNGSAQLSFTVSDGQLTTTNNINLSINPVNDAPVAHDVAYSLNEDGSIIIRASDLLRDGGAADIDSSNLVVAGISANGDIHGSLVDNGDGTWTYRPDADFNGSAQLSFTVSDDQLTTTNNINLSINPVNDAPVAHDVAYSLNEDGSIIIRAADLLRDGGAADIDSSNLVVAGISANGDIHGSLVDNGDGTWTYRPDADFNGSAQLSFTVSDGQLTTTNNINLNINPINDAPVAHDVAYSLNEDGSIIIRASDLLRDGGAADIDSSNLVISAVAANGDIHGSLVDNGDGTWTYRPDADFNGSAQLSFTVSDGQLTTTNNINLSINPVNDAPVAHDVAYSLNEDGSIIIRAADLLRDGGAADIDSSNLVVAGISANGDIHGSLVDNGDGTWTYRPDADFNGSAQLSFTVSDGQLTTTNNINLSINPVNDAPIASPLSLSMNEDSTILITASQLLSHATDIDSTTLTITNLTAPEGTLIDNGNGTWSYTPPANFNGQLNLGFTVSDGELSTSSNINLSVVDVPEHDLRFIFNNQNVESPDYTIQSQNYVLSDPSSDYTLTGKQMHTSGIDSKVSIAVDDFGNDNDRVDLNKGEVKNVEAISGTNANVDLFDFIRADAKLGDGGNSDVWIKNAQRGDILTGNGDDIIKIEANDDQDSLSNIFNVTSGDGNDTIQLYGEVNPIAGSHNSGKNKGGSHSSGGADSDQANTIFNVNAGAGNDYIVVFNDYKQANIDAGAGNDTIIGGNGRDIIQAGFGNDTIDGGAGLDSVVFTGTHDQYDITYNASNNTYTVTDLVNNRDGVDTIKNVESFVFSDGTYSGAAPVVSHPSFSINEDSSITLTKTQLLGSSYDPEGGILNISNVTANNGIIVANSDGTWTFTPSANFTGSASISFNVLDTNNNASASSATVNIAAVNDAPTAHNVAYNLNEDGSIILTASDLLRDAGATDIDSSNLSITAVAANGNIHGDLINNGNGTWTYTPNANFNGSAQLSFTVSDGQLTTSSNINLTINPVNDAPIASNISMSMLEDSILVLNSSQLLAAAGANDVDLDQLSITNISASQGTLTDNHNGTWTYIPPHDFHGAASLQFSISDSSMQIDRAINLNIIDTPEQALRFVFNDQLVENPNYAAPSENYYLNDPGDNFTLYGSTMNTHDIGNDVKIQVKDFGTADDRVDLNQGHVTNVLAESDSHANVDIFDFTRADVHLGGGGDSDVWIKDAQRGDIQTAEGNDNINLEVQGGHDLLSNDFHIDTGAGNDHLTIKGANYLTNFDINTGSGDDIIELQGKYAHAKIVGGEGNDHIYGGQGEDAFYFSHGQGHDFFDGGSGLGWADKVVVEATDPISITQHSETSWTLLVDGQEATLTTNMAGTVINNHIDFAGSADGTLVMGDGSRLDFNNIEHIEC